MRRILSTLIAALALLVVTACGGWKGELADKMNQSAEIYEAQLKLLEEGKEADQAKIKEAEALDKAIMALGDEHQDEKTPAEDSDLGKAFARWSKAKGKFMAHQMGAEIASQFYSEKDRWQAEGVKAVNEMTAVLQGEIALLAQGKEQGEESSKRIDAAEAKMNAWFDANKDKLAGLDQNGDSPIASASQALQQVKEAYKAAGGN